MVKALKATLRNSEIILYILISQGVNAHFFFPFCRLCQSSEKLGEPFLPKRAVAIDMFPFTKHFELVMALER